MEMNINNYLNNFFEKEIIEQLSLTLNKDINYLGKSFVKEPITEDISMLRGYEISNKSNSEKQKNHFEIFYKNEFLKKCHQIIFNEDNIDEVTESEFIDFGKEFTEIFTNKYFENPYDENYNYNPNSSINVKKDIDIDKNSLKLYLEIDGDIFYIIFDFKKEFEIINVNIEDIEEDFNYEEDFNENSEIFNENELNEINNLLEDIDNNENLDEKREFTERATDEIVFPEEELDEEILLLNDIDNEIEFPIDELDEEIDFINTINEYENNLEELDNENNYLNELEELDEDDDFIEDLTNTEIEDDFIDNEDITEKNNLTKINTLKDLEINFNLGGLNLKEEYFENLLKVGKLSEDNLKIPLTLNVEGIDTVITLKNVNLVINKDMEIFIEEN